MLQSKTSSRKAFEFYNSATIKVAKYRKNLDLTILDQALDDLDKSIQADSAYFLPLNYKGIVFDMKGMSTEAIAQFNQILPDTSESLRMEAEYNLAVANYHLYHEANIVTAIAILEKIVTTSISNLKLSTLAKSALSQCYGMMVLHSQKKTKNDVDNYIAKALKESGEVINIIKANEKTLGTEFIRYPLWIANNAKGISLLYEDDKVRDTLTLQVEKKYVDKLNTALSFINKAIEFSSNNWALKCNLGSAYMRLGHLFMTIGKQAEATKYFEEAKKPLFEVVTRLRPNYDFGFYELGRICRFQKDKNQAIDFFNRAKNAGGTNPNVSNESIQKNIIKAQNGDTTFIT